MLRRLVPLLFLLAAICGCSSSTAPPQTTPAPGDSAAPATITPVEVELALNWFPEVEHGGYYAALVHGYFDEAGLKVTITPGGPGASNVILQKLATGALKFGITNGDQLLTARAADVPITAVFAPLQTSPRCLIVHEKSGIKSFQDLKNLTLAVNENSAFGAVMKKKAPLTGCQIVPYPGNVAQFLLQDDFAQQAYVFSEPFDARQQGGDPVNLMATELGFNPYTSMLVVPEELLRKEPELVRKFVGACQRGWEKYLSDPAQTHDYIHQQNSEIELEVLDFGIKELRPLCIATPESAIGAMTDARWKELTDLLVECDVVKAAELRPGTVFTNEFLTTATTSSDK